MRKLWIGAILLLALAFLGLSAREAVPYARAARKNRAALQKYAPPPPGASGKKAAKDGGGRQIDFAALEKVNPDIEGWLWIPGTPIDYPILRSPSMNYYLSHDYTGAKSELGSIFQQAGADPSFAARHTILYGHNLVDNQMFGALSKYASQAARDGQPYVYVYLPGRTLDFEIYSAYECADGTKTYQLTFGSGKAFGQWLDFTRSSSLYPVAMAPGEGDGILTLSTCTDQGDKRFVVHCMPRKNRA